MEHSAKILIVDDDLVVIHLIDSMLKKADYPTDYCLNGEEALDRIKKEQYELVLLDVYLGPGMDGYEICKQIKELKPSLPVIMVTASQDEESLNKSFSSGAADYIRKPVSRLELLARVNNIITMSRAERKNKQHLQRLQNDLLIASAIQRAMLPRWAYVDDKIIFSSYYEPSEAIGGDLFEHIKISDTKYIAYIGDVSGHGVQAALFMSMIKTVLKMYLEGGIKSDSLATILTRLNSRLYNDIFVQSYYLTLFIALIDTEQETVTFFNAGHPPIIQYDTLDGNVTIHSDKGSIPLGWMPKTHYLESDTQTIHYKNTDIFLLYTDGIYESQNDKKEQFGLEGIYNIFKSSEDMKSCIALPNRIVDYMVANNFEIKADDFTLFAFQMLHPKCGCSSVDVANKETRLMLKSTMQEIASIAIACEETVKAWTNDGVLAAKVELIVDEFLNNIVAYGYKYVDDNEIIVELFLNDERLRLSFWDKGISWDALPKGGCPDSEGFFDRKDLLDGGRGLKIINTISDVFSRYRYNILNETRVEIKL